jgi:predicted permease
MGETIVIWKSLADVAPLLMLIGIGVVLRLVRIVDDDSRLVLTRIGYYVTIPVAILTSIAKAQLTPSMLWLPLIGLALPVLLSGVIYICTRGLAQQRAARGTMLIAMVGLVVFGYPFAQVFYGDAGLARMAMYDVGNVLYISTVAWWLAQSYGKRGRQGILSSLLAIVKSPFIWAAIIGVSIAIFKLPLTGPVGNLLERLAAANTPIVMIAVGTFLRPRLAQGRLVSLVVLVRMVLGGVLGWLAALLLGLRGLDIVIVTLAAALPVGTTPLIYSSSEGLDPELAASIISLSVIIGAVVINILPHILANAYLAK